MYFCVRLNPIHAQGFSYSTSSILFDRLFTSHIRCDNDKEPTKHYVKRSILNVEVPNPPAPVWPNQYARLHREKARKDAALKPYTSNVVPDV